MYFEYPSTAAMLLRNVRYGIELGFGTLSIKPFASDLNIAGRSGRASTGIAAASENAGPTFVYDINGLAVLFSPTAVVVDFRFGGDDCGGFDRRQHMPSTNNGTTATAVSLAPVLPNVTFVVRTEERAGALEVEATSDADGLLEFEVSESLGCKRLSFAATYLEQ